jgi:hypothetical protein
VVGYSGTALSKKLGVKSGYRVYLVHAPAEVIAELRDALSQCTVVRAPRGPLDLVVVFTTSESELCRAFERLSPLLTPAGMFWASWPKKSAGISTEVNERGVRESGLSAGLVDVKVCAITEVWSGLKFVRRLRDRRELT